MHLNNENEVMRIIVAEPQQQYPSTPFPHTHTPSVAFSFLKVPHMEENMSDNSKKNCGSAWSASKNNLLSPMKSTKQT